MKNVVENDVVKIKKLMECTLEMPGLIFVINQSIIMEIQYGYKK